MRLPAPFSKVKTPEEVFVEHYDWLVKWSLQFSEQFPEDANDLVHDLYLLLVRSRPRIDTSNEDRVRGYLYTMLHNLAISKARRSGHDPLSALSIVDYDSVEYGIAAVDRSELIFVRSDLARISEYAIRRKETSRAACVLILRFFLSYFPSEIVKLLRATTRVAVENHLRVARIEARAYLKKPQSLRFLGFDVTPSPAPALLPDNPESLFFELRRRLFENNVGACLSNAAIESWYEPISVSVEIPELAHIVGCPRCLDKLNRVLGLPPLAERFPGDSIDRDSGGQPPASSGGGITEDAALKRKERNTYEHQPRKLQIAVDGEIRAAQRVSLTHNELQIKLNPLRKPSFLEVFSEQGVRLLYLQLDNSVPNLSAPTATMAELSDGRSVEMEFSLARGAAVASAIYYDPYVPELLSEEGADPQEQRSLEDGSLTLPERNAAGGQLSLGIRRVRSLLSQLRFLVPVGLGIALAGFFFFFLQNLLKKPTSAVHDPVKTAGGLIAQFESQRRAAILNGGAIHSTYSLETVSSKGKVLDTETIEQWSSIQPRRSAIRLTNSRGVLLAGRWRPEKGKVLTYAKDRSSVRRRPPSTGTPNLQEVWELVPGDEAVPVWTNFAAEASIARRANEYVIHYERPANHSERGIVRADLVFDLAATRPIRQDLVLSDGGTTREYRFQELTYDVLPADQLHDSDFEPPAELGDLRSDLSPSTTLRGNNALLTLSALEILERFGPDISDALDLERLPDGRVQVSGVVGTPQQKTTVSEALMSLGASDRLKVAIHSSDEPFTAAANPQSIRVESTAPISVADTRIPLDSELREAFVSQGLAGNDLESHIRDVASAAVSDSSRLHRDAWLLQQIAAEDFNIRVLQKLRRSDQRRWIVLLDHHVRSLDQHLVVLSRDLFFLPAPSSSPTGPLLPLDNAAELAEESQDLRHDCKQMERLLMAGLTLAPPGSTSAASVTELAELLAQIKTRERVVSATVEHLATNP